MVIRVRHDVGTEELAQALAARAESQAFRQYGNKYLERGKRPPADYEIKEREQALAIIAAASKITCREAAGIYLARYGYSINGWPEGAEGLVEAARARVLTLYGEAGP